MKTRIQDIVISNLSYKIVSLLIALILWVTILGRRDFSMTKVMDLEVIPGVQQVATHISADSIRVKVSGPRTALKKFMDAGMGQIVSIDLSHIPEGDFEVEVPIRQIDVPFGVKVISVRPQKIKGRILKRNE